LRSANSSTPSTLGDALTVGSGMARISRISVIRLTPAANRPASRAPARPPSASATACSTAVTAGVRRACLLVSPLICSANVTLAHSGDRQINRRTARQITTSQPPIAVSSNRR
jgi:hypothetical protein